MKLSEYYKIMDKIAGLPEAKEDPRITYKDLTFKGGKGKEGSATIVFLDNIPFQLNCYIWDLDLDYMHGEVEKIIGSKIKFVNNSGGNGHMSWDIELITENENNISQIKE